jgi:MinD-like ATPase involved in chromosome partitioning or flagellar assembly
MGLGQATGNNSTPVVLASDIPLVVTMPSANANTAALINVVNATTTQYSADQTNTNYRGCIVVCNVSAINAGTIAVSVQGKDPISGNYYTLFTGAAVATAIMTVYQVYPASTASTSSYNGPLPTTWRVMVTAVNAGQVTYTVGAALIG